MNAEAKPREFHHKPLKVEAVRVSQHNIDSVVKWVNDKGFIAGIFSAEGDVVGVCIPTGDEDKTFHVAGPGSYVVYNKVQCGKSSSDFISVLDADVFMSLYTMVPDPQEFEHPH